jgi:hypothetical protein
MFVYLKTCEAEAEWQTKTDMDGRKVRVSKTQECDPVAQILQITTYQRWQQGEREETKITRIPLRYTFHQELEALLHFNGFRIIRQYGDWNIEPLPADSSSIIGVYCKVSGELSLRNL